MRQRFDIIGKGMYSISEVSKYTELHYATVRSWLMSARAPDQSPFLRSEFGRSGEGMLLSFLDLIEVLVVGDLRRHGVSFQTVRRAYETLKDKRGWAHPFAYKDIFTDGKKIFVDLSDDIKAKDLCEVFSGQGHFWDVMKEHLRGIDFGDDSLAVRWRISEGIIIDPAISFGKPTIVKRRVTAYAIGKAFSANGRDTELVADLFDITKRDVMRAVDFCMRYKIAA